MKYFDVFNQKKRQPKIFGLFAKGLLIRSVGCLHYFKGWLKVIKRLKLAIFAE